MKTSLIPVCLASPSGDCPPRSEGIHVSSVIRAIAAESGILKPEYVDSLDLVDVSQEAWWDNLDAVAQLRIAIGMAWDEWYLPHLGVLEVIPKPGERVIEGVYMTLDGESLDIIRVGKYRGYKAAVHEVKCTSKSVNTVGNLFSQWMWLAQMKAYCKALDTNTAYLHVLFLCGDYSYPIRPRIGPVEGEMTCWRIEFTQDEIDESWELIMGYVAHRRQLELEG